MTVLSDFNLAIMRLNGYERLSLPRWVLVTAVVSLLASLSLWRIAILVWRWWNRPIVSPKRLFRALCDQHALSADERALLQQIAAEKTFDPNFLFIDPDLWSEPASPSDSAPPSVASPRRALHSKLFGDQPIAT
jgi:hypothetical protein